jgi:hypothetical protein
VPTQRGQPGGSLSTEALTAHTLGTGTSSPAGLVC